MEPQLPDEEEPVIFFDVDECMEWCSIEGCNRILMKEIEGEIRRKNNWKQILSVYRHKREARLLHLTQ